jgi:hypothetical protein
MPVFRHSLHFHFIRSAAFNQESLMALRVLHVGLGPIGTAVVRQIATRNGNIAVGALDLDPGKDCREL